MTAKQKHTAIVVELNFWLGFESEPSLYLDRMYVMDEFSEGEIMAVNCILHLVDCPHDSV